MHERRKNPKAEASVQAEWDKLRNAGEKGCWGETAVREHSELMAEIDATPGRKVHFGAVMELCVEKNYDIPDQAKFKGRLVFRGDDVRDETGQHAIFKDMASCPATLEASKMVDAYSCVHGNAGQQADAQQAYTQATFKGTETWIFLPRHQWPAHWKGRYTRPVVPMLLALYGHPESGAYWEQHCEAHLTSQGFEVVPN